MVLAGLLAFAGAVLSTLPWIAAYEQRFGLAALFTLRGERPAPAEVVLVVAGRRFARERGLEDEPSLWPREIHAEVIERLHAAGAATLLVDIHFEKARAAPGDAALARAIRTAGNVVLSEYADPIPPEALAAQAALTYQRILPPAPAFAAAAAGTAAFLLPDSASGRVDHFWAFHGAREEPVLPVLALLAGPPAMRQRLIAMLAGEPAKASPAASDVSRVAELGALAVALRVALREPGPAQAAFAHSTTAARDRVGAVIRAFAGPRLRYFNFYGGPGHLRTLDYRPILARDAATLAAVRGKIVCIGWAENESVEQRDSYRTVFSRETGQDTAGVELAATALANLLDQSSIRALDFASSLVLCAAYGLAAGLLVGLGRLRLGILAVGVLALGYSGFATLVFASDFLWMPIVVPLLILTPGALGLGALAAYLGANRSLDAARRGLARLLPSEVAARLATAGADPGRVRRTGEVVVLSTDLEGYSRIAEQFPAERMADFLDDYLERVFAPVHRTAGRIADVKGDGVLAFWETGALDSSGPCRAAWEIARALANLRIEERAIGFRIGLAGGPAVIGMVGDASHLEYRLVGDTVNVAARVQEINKELGTRIIATEPIALRCTQFLWRPLGGFVLHGRSGATRLYELLAPGAEANPSQRELCARFGDALRAFEEARWDDAAREFTDLVSAFPGDAPSAYYRRRLLHPREASRRH